MREDKTDTNWLLLDYESDSSNKLQLTKTGTGGLADLSEHLEESKGSYAYARISFSNDKESKREKFILVVGVCTSRSCGGIRKFGSDSCSFPFLSYARHSLDYGSPG